MRRSFLVCVAAGLFLAGCTGGDGGGSKTLTVPGDLGPEGVPELGGSSRAFTVQGTSADGLSRPRGLAFHPTRDELWTVNQDTDGTVIYFDPGLVTQSSQDLVDPFAMHFMEEVSSISFGAPGFFGTCQESRNTYNGQAAPNDFMGPVLWSDDLAVYAQPSGTELGSHLDMLHESPLCMGIAWDTANVYWVFDGLNGHLVRYDFATDHGPGNDDHSDGTVRRFTEVELTRVEGVPGDMVLDHATGILYIADTGTGRVLWVDTATGEKERNLSGALEPLAEYSEWTGVEHGVVVKGLDQPSGLALDGTRLFITEIGRGAVTVVDLAEKEALGRLETPAQAIMGVAIGPDDGKVWYVDGGADELVRIDP